MTSFGGHLVAFDAETGTHRWEVELPGRFAAEISPVVVGDAVVVATTEGSVQALDREDGSVRWTAAVENGVYHTPVQVDGTLYVTQQRTSPVCGFDLETGEKCFESDPLPYGSTSYDPRRSRLYVAGSRGLVALGMDGEVDWTREFEARADRTPVVFDDVVVAGRETDEPAVLGVHAEDGERVFEVPVEGFVSALAYCPAGLLVGDGDTGLHLYDL